MKSGIEQLLEAMRPLEFADKAISTENGIIIDFLFEEFRDLYVL